MKQISVFHKGLSSDLDYSKLDNTGIVLPTANIQIINKEGQGLIVTPSEGTNVAFRVTPGYTIIGAAEYDGISYIISLNPTTKEIEFGSFPSPDPDTQLLDETYRPLNNLNTGSASSSVRSPLRTDLLEIDFDNYVGDEIVVLPDYDGSVNIVFTDYKNPVRLINSGFDQTGKYNDRYYFLQTIVDSVKLIKPAPTNQSIEFIDESIGGKMRYGNYFVYYRYVTAGGNKSEYVAESAPVTVTRNSPERPIIKVSDHDEESNKKLVFSLGELDHSFDYVELAYMRFFSDSERVVISELFVVDKLIAIPEGVFYINVEITGYETMVPISISELLKPVNNETICKTIIGYDRRLWGANWKGEEINYKALRQYAEKIRLTCDDSKVIAEWELRDFYSNSRNLKYAGYFRGEAYITGVTFKLKNGYETERFAVRGIDARNLNIDDILPSYSTPGITNTSGVIIMPKVNRANPHEPYSANPAQTNAKILALVFNVADAVSWLNLPGEDQEWIKENVIEINFLRAERKPNLMYQGIASRVYGRTDIPYDDKNKLKGNDCSIPFIADNIINPASSRFRHHGLPITLYDNNNKNNVSTFFGALNIFGNPRRGQDENEAKVRAIFSPDFIFGKQEKLRDGEQPYVATLWRQHNQFLVSQQHKPADYLCRYSYHGLIYGNMFKAKNTNIVYDENNFITPTNKTSLNLVNKVKDLGEDPFDAPDTTDALFWYSEKDIHGSSYVRNEDEAVCNRNMQTAPYFAVGADDASQLSGYESMTVVGVYRNSPDMPTKDYTGMYADELNLLYSKINDTVVVINSTQHNIVCYQGDCFLQLTAIKTRTWSPSMAIGSDRGYDEKEEVGSSISIQGTQEFVPQGRVKWWHFLTGPILQAAVINTIFDNVSAKKSEQADYRREQAKFKYAHGEIVEIVTENAINTALRFANLNETRFYPALSDTHVSWNNGPPFRLFPDDWAFYPFVRDVFGWGMSLGTGIESYLLNHGNSQTLSYKRYLALNTNVPKPVELYPNRIRYSGRQEPGRPFISYRIWDYNAREDYDERYGPINKLTLGYNKLISVQDGSIFMHQTNVEETVQGSSGEIVIGIRSILGTKPTTLASFGTQHPLSVKRGGSGTYGVDWLRNVVWRIAYSEEGGIIAASMGKEQHMESYFKDLRQRLDPSVSVTSNAVRGLKSASFNQSYLQREGIVTGYNPYNSEVLFSFTKGSRHETIGYNEKLSSFISPYTYPVLYYFNIQADMFSVESMVQGTSAMVFVHGQGEPATYYFKSYDPIISIVVNGITGENNLTFIDKLFKAIEIEAPQSPMPIAKIEFSTLFQKSSNDPFDNVTEFWLTPEYNISKWAAPINTADVASGDFMPDSSLFGKWMRITLYLPKKTNTFIKNIVTIFTTANS